MDGFNLCIFAYGQTGAGKTFTMEGVRGNRGVNYRALQELFRISIERSASVAYIFSIGILEVYNGKIRDLLRERSMCILMCLAIWNDQWDFFLTNFILCCLIILKVVLKI